MDKTQAAQDVLAERQRQISAEGWTLDHDDNEHNGGPALARAAGCYLLFGDAYPNAGQPPPHWPWDAEWWKPKNYRRDLVRAAALTIAEIERLDRAEATVRPDGFPAWICKGCGDPKFCASIQGCDSEEINT